ncbi:hypothetical protein D3C87_1341210 [compost metagenome]
MTRTVHVHLHRRTGDFLSGELEKRAVYAHMPLGPVSAEAVRLWARSIGVIYDERSPHVTTAYSLKPVAVAPTYRTRDGATRDNAYGLVVPPGGRRIDRFGNQLVLCLDSPALRERWQAWRKAGATWDYPDYQPHITFADLKHQGGATIDISGAPFDEPITLLPEIVERPRSFY